MENKIQNKIKVASKLYRAFQKDFYWLSAMVSLNFISKAEAGYILIH